MLYNTFFYIFCDLIILLFRIAIIIKVYPVSITEVYTTFQNLYIAINIYTSKKSYIIYYKKIISFIVYHLSTLYLCY